MSESFECFVSERVKELLREEPGETNIPKADLSLSIASLLFEEIIENDGRCARPSPNATLFVFRSLWWQGIKVTTFYEATHVPRSALSSTSNSKLVADWLLAYSGNCCMICSSSRFPFGGESVRAEPRFSDALWELSRRESFYCCQRSNLFRWELSLSDAG